MIIESLSKKAKDNLLKLPDTKNLFNKKLLKDGNVNPETLNLNGVATLRESGGYLATIADRRLLTTFSGVGTTGNTASTQRPYSNSSLAETIRGTSFTLTAISATSLFGNNTRLLTSITIEGIDSGARVTIPLEISKEVIATTSTGAETGVTLT